MSTFDLPEISPWDERPIKHSVGEAKERNLLQTTGRLTSIETTTLDGHPCYLCTLDDNTGSVTLVFIGRSTVPGLTIGTICGIEGTVGYNTKLGHYIFNPFYRIEA